MNKRNIILCVLFFLTLFSLSSYAIFKNDTKYSVVERRELKTKDNLTTQGVLSGEYMKNFESASLDQFPFRDSLRQAKSVFARYVLLKSDNNSYYIKEGHISKIEDKENKEMMDYAISIFNKIYKKYMENKDVNIYLSIIPDKNYYLGEKYGYPHLDYDSFSRYFKDNLPYMTYIDLADDLSINDYYKTDTHWKQENLLKIKDVLLTNMGTALSDVPFSKNLAKDDFHGVYASQSGFNTTADKLYYLTSDIIDNLKCTYYDQMGKKVEGNIYDFDKLNSNDNYEMFLKGSQGIIEIENENAKTSKELIVFRDSFGSSLCPLLSHSYKKITIVDIRYVFSDSLGFFVDFTNQDVLFLYSTTLLNSATALR